MKDLFDVLKETLKNSEKGHGNTGNTNGATGLLGSAAVGGMLAALFGGSKALKGLIKDGATVSGGAIAGAIAYKIFQKWAQTRSNGTPNQQPSTADNADKGIAGAGFSDNKSLASEEGVISSGGANDRNALLLIEAMVFAARADGHIEEAERAAILKATQNFSTDANFNDVVQIFLQKPLEPLDIASRIDSYDQGLDVYRLSASVITPDSFMEKAYLEGLARALRISDRDREILNTEAKAMREELLQGFNEGKS